ncbi:hypothetical protein [Paenibacillus ferrarius]|uniref:hypothetical protein n=1 Tax=Paenibacillus ferrarius TaxID=1469647 RepID=UPI003D2CE535
MKALPMKKLLVSSVALAFLLGGALQAGAQEPAQTDQSSVTAKQADEKGGGQHKRRWPIIEEAATVIGVDKEALFKTLKGGKSIVEAAAEKGISEADLTAKLMAMRTSKIETAVKDGKLTAEQGEHMKQGLGQHLKFILNEKNLLDRHSGHGKHHKFGLHPDTEKLAKSLGLTKDELHAQLRSGKSLAEIAQAKGVSKDKLVANIKEQLTPSIEKWVDHKRVPKANEKS